MVIPVKSTDSMADGPVTTERGIRTTMGRTARDQRAGASGDLSGTRELLERLRTEFDHVRPALEAEMGEGRGG
jgi:hypothetical protein